MQSYSPNGECPLSLSLSGDRTWVTLMTGTFEVVFGEPKTTWLFR